MNDLEISTLLLILLGLTFFVAFFAGSETGMMSMNRYRLRHMAKNNVRGAKLTQKLLERPDRLISTILIGNNFINNFAAAIATVIGLRLLGDGGLETATAIITIVMLIFGEVMPKTFAALKPERFALPASYVLAPMLKIMYPIVWAINMISNSLLKLVGLNVEDAGPENLSREELRTIIHEAGAMIPRRHQKMLLSILDLENSTVEDVMVPINEIEGIDINDDMNSILTQLRSAQFSRVPVYDTEINNPIGVLLLRKMARAIGQNELNKEIILQQLEEPYYIPEGTPLNTQLVNFQREKKRIGLVVDEYGDVKGLVSLQDILEEIVGEFTTARIGINSFLHPQADGSFIVEGSAHVREINRDTGWKLPTTGPKTLSGLLIETLEHIPESNICLKLGEFKIEILAVKDNMIKSARIIPPPARQ